MGIKASLIRQVLIERAQSVEEAFKFDEDANERYHNQLSKKLELNLHGQERSYRKQRYGGCLD